jgi:hypothetical protein
MFKLAVSDKEKCFKTLPAGVDVIKLFPLSLTMRPNKLERFCGESLSNVTNLSNVTKTFLSVI